MFRLIIYNNITFLSLPHLTLFLTVFISSQRDRSRDRWYRDRESRDYHGGGNDRPRNLSIRNLSIQRDPDRDQICDCRQHEHSRHGSGQGGGSGSTRWSRCSLTPLTPDRSKSRSCSYSRDQSRVSLFVVSIYFITNKGKNY